MLGDTGNKRAVRILLECILGLVWYVKRVTFHMYLYIVNIKMLSLPPAKRSLRRLCFYTCLSVILCTGGSVSVHAGIADPPREQTPPCSACWEIQPTSGRYASYWNAYLLLNVNNKFDSLWAHSHQYKRTLTRYTHSPVERRIATVIISVFNEKFQLTGEGERGVWEGGWGCKNYMT